MKSDGQWWAHYVVRYFVGTVLGVFIVLFLVTATSPSLSQQGGIPTILRALLKLEHIDKVTGTILAVVGLAFCYIASAPVLVLHATRGSLLATRRSIGCKTACIGILASGLVSWGLIHRLPNADEFNFAACVMILLAIIFVGQIFLLCLALFQKESKSFEYYDSVVKKRAEAEASGKEYMESYRHLREHGNAFLIAYFELFLGTVLYYTPLPWGVILMLWVLPSGCVWFFGTMLESRPFK